MTRYLMHTNTGSVDTAENWEAEGADLENPDLVEVVPADGAPVPEDFNPANSDKIEWVEAS